MAAFAHIASHHFRIVLGAMAAMLAVPCCDAGERPNFLAEPVMTRQGGCARFHTAIDGVRPFIGTKRGCLGEWSPLADLAEVDLVDRYDGRTPHRYLLAQRPLQLRAGIAWRVASSMELGVGYAFTGARDMYALRFNQSLPMRTELAGHTALLRLRAAWP